ncbi:YedE family putative selenium transporter [Guggenheimella bovis]
MNLTNSKSKLFIWGLLAGAVAVVLALTGNPKNMAICIACFIRDIAGSVGAHTAPVVQYFRPEIVGIVLGSFILSSATGEYRAMGGSSSFIRFILGMVMMIGALVFLGCPTRMVIRMAAGDLNAWVGLIGFVLGVLTGIYFLKRGFSLGRSKQRPQVAGGILPTILVIGFILSITTTWFFVSKKGPGSFHAPVVYSIIGGILFGMIAQRTRMCFAGGFRDLFLFKNVDLLSILVGIFVSMLIYNVATKNFAFKFDGNPVAHAQHLWNILGLYIVGFSAILLGGCPLRQLILAGQGNTDSALTFLGMFVGAALCHRIGLAAVAQDVAKNVAGGPGLNGKIAVGVCLVILFAVAILKSKKGVKLD